MSGHPQSKAVVASLRFYRRLLAAYPKAHREEYGGAMEQLFRDQCRAAWCAGHHRGLALLWLRVLPDLLKSSFLEQLSALKGRKSMADKILEVSRIPSAAWRVFRNAFAVVFLLVFLSSILITFILPESYASTTRILLRERAPGSPKQGGLVESSGQSDPYRIQTEFEVIQSELILGKVVDALHLRTKWGQQYVNGAKLSSAEAIQLLKARLDLRPVRNTSLIEIRVYSGDPKEAAEIANRIASTYSAYRKQENQLASEAVGVHPADTLSVAIIDQAKPGTRPVRPNKPLNIVLGFIIGGLVASGIGGLLAWLVSRRRRPTSTPPPLPV